MPRADLRAARANRVFCTDEKRIRTENAVRVNPARSAGFSYKIADCLRTASRPCAIDDRRGRVFVRAILQLSDDKVRDLSRRV